MLKLSLSTRVTTKLWQNIAMHMHFSGLKLPNYLIT